METVPLGRPSVEQITFPRTYLSYHAKTVTNNRNKARTLSKREVAVTLMR